MKKFLLFCLATFCLTACKTLKEEIPVASVTISQLTVEMFEGETVQLKATVFPSNATEKTVIWASSKMSVATVSDSGFVTAVAEGTSTITASAGGKSASCVVTVSKRVIEVTSVTLNKESLELVEGEEETLVATVKPDNATDKTVEWSSSAPDIAKVDDGKVSALKEGEAIITAKAGTKSASCKVVVTKKFIAVESVELNKTNLELVEGDSDILVATVKPDDATDKTVTWISSDDEVVFVDDSGKVKALKEGKATIAAKAGEKTATCEVAVSKKVIPVESITLDRTSISMVEDESTALTATVKPDNATDKTVTWSSSDTGVATVKDGRVTSIKEGKATITAKAGEKEATCEIIVSKRIIEVTSITLNYPDLSLVKGEEQVLVATVEPDNATDKTVTWSSSNAQIASVDKEGKVKALKSGTATITAKAGEKTATCEVTVSTPVESISLDRTSMTLEEGQSTSLTATVTPNDADEKTASWSSSNANVATVDQSGKVTAVKEGTATITAKAGGKSATCDISVNKRVIPVASITLNKSSLTLEKGKSEILTATVKPDDATDKTVNWSSNDDSVASVDSQGKVTAVKGGQAVITAKAGEQSATCVVTVTVPVSSLILSESSLNLTKGQSVTLTATVNPSDATDKTVTWSSSDEYVATVSEGKITAKKSGSAIITAKAGDQKATCTVTVTNPVTSITLDKTSVTLKEGESTTLTAVVLPEDADDKTVTWKSSNTSVAITYATGLVMALREGQADITAQAGDKSASCRVMVEAPAVSVTKITYKEAEGEVVNPERGLYTTFEIHKASYSLSSSSVKAKVASGHTVQLLEFYLTDYMDRDISSDYLDMIQKCFDAMRGGGAKAIVRFAYKDHYTEGEEMEPEVSQVLSHVAQLKPILQRNEDVLFVLQAGFVGAWGEWYYTTHFIMSPKTDADYAPRKQLAEALLDAVPTSRQIELRTPKFKMRMYKLSLSDTLRASTAHNGSPLSRLAGHNDCFGASSSDSGTFESSDDRKFWKAETRYTIMGGETCKLSDYCLCAQSLKDLEDYHWTYLHDGYNRDVLNRWKTDGCFDEIKARLGYRLVLQEVEYETPRAGQSCTVTLRLKNKGYAAPMNPRQAYLIWKNDNGATQKIPLGSDPRTWHPGNTQVTVSFTPQSARGTLYLELSDPLLPDNPAYSIALANQDIFDSQTGYNRLFDTL